MQPATRPNILVIVTDQQRADTIGALGNPIIKTPAIDSLCASGTAFVRGYTPAPICSPARISMVTGILPHHHRFTDHDWWHCEPKEGGPSAAPHDPAFMEICRDQGYQTLWAGKMHHSGRSWLSDGIEEAVDGDPNKQMNPRTRQLPGYREWVDQFGYLPYNRPSMALGSEYYMVPQITQAPEEHTQPHFLADQCIEFLQRRDPNRPFLINLHFPEPHPPITNPMPWGLLYRAPELDAPHRPDNYKDYQSRTNRYQMRYKMRDTAQEDDTVYRTIKGAYYGNISMIDYNIGRLLEALGDERENTLIIFTSDHGEMLGDYGCVGKRCMLEGSIRVPLIVSWPGHVPAGKRCTTPATLTDLFPTICDATGVPQSRSVETRSLIELANEPDTDRIVFSQFSSGWCGQYAATDGQWKYAWSAPDRKEWLFRLDDSLREGSNRIDDAEAAEPLARLRGALLKRHDPSNDPWSNAVENGAWKIHDVPAETWHHDPTYGYLNQEKGPDQLQASVDALGPYARQVINLQHGSLHKDHGVCGGEHQFLQPAPAEMA